MPSLNVSSTQATNVIHVDNSKARYYSDLAEIYKDDAYAYAQQAAASAEQASIKVSETSSIAAQATTDIDALKDAVLGTINAANTDAVDEVMAIYTSVQAAGTASASIITSATSAGTSAIAAREGTALTNIDAQETSSLSIISSTTTSSIASISSSHTSAITAIRSEKAEAISDIDEEAVTQKNSMISSINSAATSASTSAVANATSAITTAKNNAISSINTATTSATEAALETIEAAKTDALEAIAESADATARWGNLTGNIDDQTDLNTKFNTKADGLYYDDQEGLLYLTCGETIISDGIEVSRGGGGGGGGYGSVVTLTNKLASDTLYVATGEPTIISYQYDDSEDLDATAQYKVNNVIKHTARINSGTVVNLDIKDFLEDGYNYVQIKVTDLNGASKNLIYVVNTVSLGISSTFDETVPYTSPITFRYTPTGDITKTIHFEVDGTELETETVETSGRQQSKVITLTHGVHTLRVWASAVLNGNTVLSNILSYEVMYVTSDTTLITSDFDTVNYTEGETINIPLIVYNPNSLTTDVDVYMNNTLVSEMNVGRTKFTWSKVLTETGNIAIRFEAGGSTRTFNIVVAESEMDVEAVTENLELYLTASGRSNSDLNKTSWTYGNISCTLSDFNYVTNGWINNALKISNGASVTIPFKPFQNDFRTNGKTIEIEFSTSNIVNYNSVVASCMSGNRGFSITAQSATFKSEQSQVDVKFKEDEHIRLGFVVENRSSNRLIYTYLNGIISGITQYPSDDDFSQISPVNITLGSSGCDLDIYNIRIYDTALTHYDMLNNYIADTSDLSRKLSLYTANNIHDAYGNILYNKLINQIPIMTITGSLPGSKGDKKTVTIEYENQADETKNFTMSGVTLDVQGTSSQYYPKKNYKISKLPTAYSLRTGGVGEKVFTMKADYMESSHAHNTGLARFINDIYETLTPPQINNESIRTAIDGFPIAMFYRANANTQPSYFGVYNFNNDKSSNDTFGFTDGCESWEFCNNTSNRCLFLTNDFSDSEAVLTDFEARFPKDYTNYSNLQDLVSWVYGCYQLRATTGVSKFKSECSQHFNVDFLLTYYILTEFFGMVDSRAKNMFLNYYVTDGLWYPVFYDLDTAIGLNNEGVNDFNFDIETHDTIGTKNVFNGENSALWYLVEQAYASELNELYNTYRNDGKLTYERVMSYLYTDQIAKICEAQYNADAEFKYISPLVNDGIATYLYTAQGSRLDHIKWWISSRFNYMDSKYTASDYKSNYLTMRLYTPQEWEDVEPDATIKVTPYADQYVRIKYGSYDVYQRGYAGQEATITPPAITFNDTETILYGASRITSIGDLSPLYAGTIDVSKALKLTTLKIGAGGDYSNTNLNEITLGNNTMLQELDVRNCPNLTGALDVSGCTNIKVIKATGTGLSSVKLADAGSITDLLLPNSITNLTVKNQNSITNFACGTNISTLILENTNLDAASLLENNPVTKVRIAGIDWTITDFDLLDDIYDLVGSDENGNNLPHGVLAGTIRMSHAKESVVNEYKKKFVGINFVIGSYDAEDYIATDFGEAITTNDGKVLLYT